MVRIPVSHGCYIVEIEFRKPETGDLVPENYIGLQTKGYDAERGEKCLGGTHIRIKKSFKHKVIIAYDYEEINLGSPSIQHTTFLAAID